MRLLRGLLPAVLLSGWVLAAWWIDAEGTTRASAAGADCALVVLGARVEEGGRPSETLAERVRAGVRLRLAGQGALLLFSGGVGDFPPAEAEVGRAMAVAAGVPPSQIVVEAASHSTRENARESAKLLRARGLSCVHLVSDPYHLARARWAFEREGFRVTLGPVEDAPRHRSFPTRLWWTAREVPAFAKMMLAE